MSKFLVNFPCKPYVKRFLEINYGDSESLGGNSSIDISKDKALYAEFQQKLKNKSFRFESRLNTYAFERYSDGVNIKITQDDFYRYGWELTKTDIVYLNSIFEGRCKVLMYTAVGIRVAIGMNLTNSIELFQDKFMFTEDIWQKDSIYKDCRRNLHVGKNEIAESISEIIDKITLETLSRNKTISRKAKIVYENNNI